MFESEQNTIEKLFEVVAYKKPESPENTIEQIIAEKKTQKPLFLYLEDRFSYTPGKPGTALAERSYLYFKTALHITKTLNNSSLVTLPVSKELIIKAGIRFAGHTEELISAWNVPGFMCMYHPLLSVIPLTNHIPLKTVPAKVLKTDIVDLGNSLLFFQKLFQPKLPFAMTGLNPHSGEGGKIGTEEAILSTFIDSLQKKRIRIEGPMPADAAFMKENRKKYSAILTMYHDQGLIPFKALIGSAGLNITLSLPRLRVSPDHGPAYDCAGKNNADIQSVLNSLLFAMDWGKKWIKLYSSLS